MYYLPIVIGRTRMHICHLGKHNPPLQAFEFILPLSGPDELFKVSADAKFVADSGKRIDSDALGFKVKAAEHTADPAALDLEIIFQEKSIIGKDGSYHGHYIDIKRDEINALAIRSSDHTKIQKLQITLIYREREAKPEQQQLDYDHVYRFVIHLPKRDDHVYHAAIDFGSEASQVGYVKDNDNNHEKVALIQQIKDFHHQYSELKPKDDNYWQGDPNDKNAETCYFYKSVFFVDKLHNAYAFTDRPNKHGENTFLKTLVRNLTVFTTEGQNIYAPLFLLPNLKLVELLGKEQLAGVVDHIKFSSASANPAGFEGRVNILSPQLIEQYIRLILNALLHTVLESLNTQPRLTKYLTLTLLVPNVYAQDKIYRLLANLYQDFNEIINDPDLPHLKVYKGLEVKVLSESDASFLGLRIASEDSKDWKIENRKYGHYLIIDAGKGTTDFSIIRQRENYTDYESIFRAGLPGSGQYLTHGFIDALNNALPADMDLYDLILGEAGYPHILDFMSLMEVFKTRHEEFTNNEQKDEGGTIPAALKNKYSSLREVNTMLLETFINNRWPIPGSDAELDRKINRLVDEIYDQVEQSHIKEFHQIILAGRTFKLARLREKIAQRFATVMTGTDPAKNPIVFQEDSLKQVCLTGAFHSRFFKVNFNSELIGLPVAVEQPPLTPPPAEKKGWFSKWRPAEATPAASGPRVQISGEFFYQGAKYSGEAYSNVLRIGSRSYMVKEALNKQQDFHLFFKGDGFLKLWPDSTAPLEHVIVDSRYSDMVKETLFPFAFIQFDNPEQKKANHPFKNRKQVTPEKAVTAAEERKQQPVILLPEAKQQRPDTGLDEFLK